jgi:hypothetical protein
MQLTPGDPLNLTAAQRRVLAPKLANLVTDLEDTYAPLFGDIRRWWEWYEAKPRMKVKDFPFRGASNIVVPLSQIMVDALVNRTMAALFGVGRRIWMGYTENDIEEKLVNNVVRHLNWAANNNDFNFRLVGYDWILEAAAIGSSVLGLNWREDLRYVFHRSKGKVSALPVRYGRGPLLEAIPRNLLLWDTNYLIGDAPCVVREYHFTWSEVQQLASNDRNGTWYTDEVEFIRDHPGLGGPGADVSNARRVMDGANEHLRPGPYEKHDFRAIHLDWPLYSYFDEHSNQREDESLGDPTVGVVLTVHRKTGRIVRGIAEPYFFPSKPFFDIYYKKRTGRGHSVGVVKKLEHMQSAITTQLNQSIDAMTRANSVWAKTKDRQHLDKPIDPRHPIFDPTNSFEPFLLPANTIDNQRNIQMVQVIAERLTGIADPALGRESRQGGHPSPATSTLALMAQSDIMTYSMRELIRGQMGRLGESIASLYQQFETNDDGKLARVLGDRDARDVSQYYFPTDPIVGNIHFDVVAMNEATNPDAEMQRAILVEQMNTNYWAKVLKVLPALESPQVGPMVKKAILASIEAGTRAHVRFLEASNVDDIERLTLEARRAAESDGAAMGAFASGLREVAGGSGVLPKPPMGQLPVGPGMGAPEAPGVVGAL